MKNERNGNKKVRLFQIKNKKTKIMFYLAAAVIAVLFLYMTIAGITGVSNGNNGNGNSTEEAKHYCSPESRNSEFCITVYKPVCGWFNESIKCFRYPCAATYSNECLACQDPKVAYWTDGECPS